MTKIFKTFVLGALVAFASGCINNDVPYPIIKLDILALEADGLNSAPQIDAVNKSVTLELEETTDIRNVNITSITITEGATSSVTFPATFDLRVPLYVELTKYQTYEWKISAQQSIERYFTVEGQIGESKIDAEHHVATALVPM